MLLFSFGCGNGKSPAQPTSSVPTLAAPTPQVFWDQKRDFDDAVRGLGTRTVIDFEDIDARPISDTISGRTPFNGQRYTNRGVVFSNPNNVHLYIAPRGLEWNPTNSLSVGRFPFDPLEQMFEAPFIEDDDLGVAFDPDCSAAAFSVIDKGRFSPDDDFIQFFDAAGGLIQKVAFPRTFLGIISSARRIARILISETGNDGDDVTYDDFVCVR